MVTYGASTKRPQRPPAAGRRSRGDRSADRHRTWTSALSQPPAGEWLLPSGRRIAEFALASGFLAPRLMADRMSPDEKERASGNLETLVEAGHAR
jgi:hypothetical protein